MDKSNDVHKEDAKEATQKSCPDQQQSRPHVEHQNIVRIQTINEGSATTDCHGRDKASSPPLKSASATPGSSTTQKGVEITSPGGGDGISRGQAGESPKRSPSYGPPVQHGMLLNGTQSTGPRLPQNDPNFQNAESLNNTTDRSTSAIKILVSNNVAGFIIGRAGQTISELQAHSQTRIKLSQSGDFYPGTQDRVCLIQGEPASVKVALQLLLDRLYKLQEAQHTPAWQQQSQQKEECGPSFEFIVRLLVPLSCCGMIIGKSGSNIKFMEETVGVSSVRLSPKDDESVASTSERILTVTGSTMENCLQCLYLVFHGMTSHPDISRYTNMTTSYNICEPVEEDSVALLTLPAMSPRYTSTDGGRNFWEEGSNLTSFSSEDQSASARRIASSPDLHGVLVHQQPLSSNRYQHNEQQLTRYSALKDSEFLYATRTTSQTNEMSSFVNPHQPAYTLSRNAQQGPQVFGNNQAQEVVNYRQDPQRHIVPTSASAPNLMAVQLDQSLHRFSPLPSLMVPSPPPSLSPNEYNFTPQTPTLISPGCFNAQILIPDSMIGSILGRGGQTLTELQMMSGTRIRISQRGEYMPGTRSRIVTIRGPTAPTVWHAQLMISQHIVLPPTAYNVPSAPNPQVSYSNVPPHNTDTTPG